MTMIQPTDSELAEGIAPWDDTCASSFAGKRCALPVGHSDDHSAPIALTVPEFPQDMSQLAAFELDREARSNAHYLSKLLAHRDSGHARVNGSIGCTSIVPVGAPVNVSRGAW